MHSKAIYRNNSLQAPQTVAVLVFQERINIYSEHQKELLGAAHLNDCHATEVDDKLFLYLDKAATAYLIIDKSEPVFYELKAKLFHRNNRRRSRGRLPALVAIFMAILIGLYLLVMQAVPFIGLKLISRDHEISLGKQFYQSFMEGTDINIPQTHIAQQFADELKLSDLYPIKVTVLNDSTVNAFALPGGNIVIFTGLMQSLKSETEFAALLSHEVSHINQRHSLRSVLQSMASALVISIVIGDANGLTSFLIENADMLRQLNYSRTLEREADEEGMKLLVRNKINPVGMKQLMARLQEKATEEEESFAFLSTHPLTKKRVKHAEKFIKKQAPKSYSPNPVLVELWQQMHSPDAFQ